MDKGSSWVRTDTWRLDPPSKHTSPLAVRRISPLNTRRQACHHIFTASGYTDDSDGSGDDVRYLIRRNIRDKTNVPLVAYEQNIITDTETKASWDNTDEKQRHVRFRTPDIVKTGVYEFQDFDLKPRHSSGYQDSFVVAFGQRGKGVGHFEDAKDIVVTKEGKLLVTDMIQGRIQIFCKKTKQVKIFSSEDICFPWGTVCTSEDLVVFTQYQNGCVKLMNADGNIVKTFGNDGLSCATGIAVTLEGNYVVCDEKLNNVFVFTDEGNLLGSLANQESKDEVFSKPRYACVAQDGDIIISDSGHHSIKIFDNRGTFKLSFGSFGKDDGQFKSPYGICTNQYGDIIVADHYNCRISMFSKNGEFIRHLVTRDHGLIHPQGLTMDQKMYLYVTHGRLKATEVLIYKMETRFPNIQYTGGSSHV